MEKQYGNSDLLFKDGEYYTTDGLFHTTTDIYGYSWWLQGEEAISLKFDHQFVVTNNKREKEYALLILNSLLDNDH